MPSPVGGIDSIRSNQMTITNYQNEYRNEYQNEYRNEYQNEYRNEYQNEYLTLSALGDGEIMIVIPSLINQAYATSLSCSKDKLEWVDGVAPAGTFIKIAPMTLWSIGASGVPSGWTVLDYEISKFARPA